MKYVCDYCGEIFENEEECYDCECDHKWRNSPIIKALEDGRLTLWDKDGNIVSSQRIIDEGEDFLEDKIFALQCCDSEAAEALEEFVDCEVPYENQLLHYDTDTHEWIDIERRIDRLYKLLQKYKGSEGD